jgi:predicted transcriptional regulator
MRVFTLKGMSGANVGKLLGLGQPAVSRAVVRGEKISRDMNIQLINLEIHFFMTVPYILKIKSLSEDDGTNFGDIL